MINGLLSAKIPIILKGLAFCEKVLTFAGCFVKTAQNTNV